MPDRRDALLSLGGMLAIGAFPRVAEAQEATTGAPDLSRVTSKRAARKLVREGRLVEIGLFPIELGGPDDEMNLSWITPEAAEAREQVIGTLHRYLEDKLIDKLQVLPDYKGESVVPSRITMNATHSSKPGGISFEIAVW